MEKERLKEEHIISMVSDFLDGKPSEIEHIRIKGVTGIRDIYVKPIGTGIGQFYTLPNVIRAKLVTPDGREFGEVAVKHHATAVKDEDIPTLLPPTVASRKGREHHTQVAVQMWMEDPTAEEFLFEVGKVLAFWDNLVPKRKGSEAEIADIRPDNIKKWAVDINVMRRDLAKHWAAVALEQFLDRYGRDGVKALRRVLKVSGTEGEIAGTITNRIDVKTAERIIEALRNLHRSPEFWRHHLEKDLKIWENIKRMGKISEKQKKVIEKLAEHLMKHGHEQIPESLLNLAELERNIVAEWISAYKREVARGQKHE